MLTNLGEWAAAHVSSRAAIEPAPAPANFTVVTECPGHAWTILARRAPATTSPSTATTPSTRSAVTPTPSPTLGWIHHLGSRFEVTRAGDPIRVARTTTFAAGINFLLADVVATHSAPSPVCDVG